MEKGDRLPYLAPIQGNTQVMFEQGKWLAAVQIQALSARKSSASNVDDDLPEYWWETSAVHTKSMNI